MERNKQTDTTGDAGCLLLACMGVLLAFSLLVILVLVVIIVARGCALGC